MLVGYLRSTQDRWGRALHFAPEPQVSTLLRARTDSYTTADLFGANDLRLDITRLPFPDGAFDLIVCCHVLEHVPNDASALSELRRVLSAQGTILLQVPQHGGATTDEAIEASPEERERRFGQADHVRIYGEDFVKRLVVAGLTVVELDSSFDFRAPANLHIPGNERLFICSGA